MKHHTPPERAHNHHSDNPTNHTVCSEPEFNFLLQRERSRSDRGHGIFSLIIFNLPTHEDTATCQHLIDILTERIRITDNIGWLNPTALGVMLADTAHAGGTTFAKDVSAHFERNAPAPDYYVYTYPSDSAAFDESPDIASHAVEDGANPTERFLNQVLAQTPSLVRQIIERTLAGVILMALSPLFLLIALAIKLSSPGPCLYGQMRVGHKGELFRCYKFRSMHLDVDTAVHADYFKTLIESDQPMQKLDTNDPRIFTVGRMLRASSLDELPQLLNILKGEMSFIGPRPAIPGEYRDYHPWHRHRIDVLPGLTGLWQVNGKNKTTFSEMMRFDTAYAQHHSLRMDSNIVFKTPKVVLAQFLDGHPRRRTRLISRKKQSIADGG